MAREIAILRQMIASHEIVFEWEAGLITGDVA